MNSTTPDWFKKSSLTQTGEKGNVFLGKTSGILAKKLSLWSGTRPLRAPGAVPKKLTSDCSVAVATAEFDCWEETAVGIDLAGLYLCGAWFAWFWAVLGGP